MGQKLSFSTNSERTFEVGKNWIADCLKNHTACIEAQSRRAYQRPTRLLKIDDASIRLVLASELPPAINYCTLSYCWGLALFLKLTDATFGRMRGGIGVSDLPLTFREAVHACQKFGFQYIWIDALCILQDSAEEWKYECALMGDVYLGSALNISALASADGNGGLFRTRDPKWVEPYIANLARTGSTPKNYRIVVKDSLGDHWESEFKGTPASERGWILQERILAPRIIHFGPNQILWECNQLAASEVFPDGSHQSLIVEERKIKLALSETKEYSNDEVTTHALSCWDDIVDLYSRMNLTKPEDKLPALSGIAKEIQGLLKCGSPNGLSVRYLAGLWDTNLLQQLAWHGKNYPIPARPSKYRAPSWSWASANGKIWPAKYDLGKSETVTAVVRVDVELSTTDVTGPVSGGNLYLRGPLRSIKLSGIEINSTTILGFGFEGLWSMIHLDIEIDVEDEDLYCIALGNSGPALLLQRTECEGQFRRVGLLDWALGFNDTPREFYRQALLEPRMGQCPQYKCYSEETTIYDIEIV